MFFFALQIGTQINFWPLVTFTKFPQKRCDDIYFCYINYLHCRVVQGVDALDLMMPWCAGGRVSTPGRVSPSDQYPCVGARDLYSSYDHFIEVQMTMSRTKNKVIQ